MRVELDDDDDEIYVPFGRCARVVVAVLLDVGSAPATMAELVESVLASGVFAESGLSNTVQRNLIQRAAEMCFTTSSPIPARAAIDSAGRVTWPQKPKGNIDQFLADFARRRATEGSR